jgi:hypothetical protein
LSQCARIFAGAFVLAGCAGLVPQTVSLRDDWPNDLPEHVELAQAPFFPQEDYQCGPAALATVMVQAGARTTPDALVPEVYLPERKGTLQAEMLAAPRRHGLVSYAIAPQLDEVLREVAAGTPVVVLHGYGVWPVKLWHYSVVIGYDRPSGDVILRSGTHERQLMPFAVLEYTWKESNRWAMVVTPPGRIPATADEGPSLEAINAFARVAKPDAASTAYRAFLARWPDNATASIGLGNVLHAAGDLRQAEAVLREAHRRHPDSVPVMNNLAQTLSDRGRQREALALIDRARSNPGSFASSVDETRAGILKRMTAR